MSEKKEIKKTVYFQYEGKEISIDEVEDTIRENYALVNNGEEPEDIKIYLKPEDRKAYYVVNSRYQGEVNFLPD